MTFKSFKEWFLIIVPPLLLVPLFMIPFDLPTAFFWLIAAIAFIRSVYGLLKSGIASIRAKKEGDGFSKKDIKLLLVVLIVPVTVVLINLSIDSADNYALKIANEVQAECKKNKMCPSKVDGWEPAFVGDSYVTHYGEYGSKFNISFHPEPSAQEFSIVVRHSIDVHFVLKGGVEKELKEEFLYD